MNPESNTDAAIPATRLLYWAVRGEFWENRSICLAPLAVAGLILLGFLISTISLPGKIRAASALSPMEQHNLISQPYLIAAGMMMLTTLAVGVFYSLDALTGNVGIAAYCSEVAGFRSQFTVLSKAIIPVVIFVAHVRDHRDDAVDHALVSSAVLLANGPSAAPV